MRVTLRLACCGLFLFCRLSFSGPGDDQLESLADKVYATSEFLRAALPIEKDVYKARAAVAELEKDIHAFCDLVLQDYPELAEPILAIPVVDQQALLVSIKLLQGMLALYFKILPHEEEPISQIWSSLENMRKIVPHIAPCRPDFAACTNGVEQAYRQLQKLKKTLMERYPEVAPMLVSQLTQLEWLRNECDTHIRVFYALKGLIDNVKQRRRVLALCAQPAAQQPVVENHPPEELWLEHRRGLPLTPAPKKSTLDAVLQWLAGWKT